MSVPDTLTRLLAAARDQASAARTNSDQRRVVIDAFESMLTALEDVSQNMGPGCIGCSRVVKVAILKGTHALAMLAGGTP